eukprot:CAMPEP_0167750626 /NCGR_PEP_ID=MMETSP0110_2-20121227/6099_1 /TAXON_ID=629695 /ORGANISM="Gymnochlora sp., Strain CCMP2014" /LENGTH=317 /DNA_ID=CAMNT_0007635975 /DNA_START=68 /DNA_END=1021 /DNA_ORIENTATION=-
MSIILLICLVITTLMPFVQSMEESIRVKLYRSQFGHEWPPREWPTNDGWDAYTRQKELNISRIENRDTRWFEWMNLVQTMSLPNFTSHGFELVDLPESIWGKLRQKVLSVNLDDVPWEPEIDHEGIAPRPRFLDTSNLNQEVLQQLQAYHEDWCGFELELSRAYGMRYYLHDSTLVWHLDKLETHVISGILHIASEPDQDIAPWPLEIVGNDGKEYKIILQPGQLLFYESAKLLHGRPSRFKGKWYTSLFLHYRPKDWSMKREDMVTRVPEHWEKVIRDSGSGDTSILPQRTQSRTTTTTSTHATTATTSTGMKDDL